MGSERSCRLCKNMKVKNKFLGGKKLICAIHNHEVEGIAVCPQFVRDGDKVLQYAGFRAHEFGSSDGCDSCAHLERTHGKAGVIYSCKMNNVQFYSGFSPPDHICNGFEDGGQDALIASLADLLIEQDRHKKGGT